jgi:type I restriction enzyme M protein
MSEDQKKLLEQQLWNIANTLRGKMDADEFRDYILGFIFYKYLSEKMHLYADEILKEDGIRYLDIDEVSDEGKQYLEAIKEHAVVELGYFLKPSELFSVVAKKGNAEATEKAAKKADGTEERQSNFILEDLAKILKNIEQSTMGTDSEDDFDHLFEDLDLTSTKLGRTEAAKNGVISKVLAHLDKIDFKLKETGLDVLGDAYEYLIGKFASGAGKKAGEFYTPQEVSIVLSKIVTTGKKKLKSVYDPSCGSGSLLLRVAKEVKEVSNFYGQEMNRTTYNLARMNMILHGVHYSRFNIKQEDTLERPQHVDQKFEAIVANPPFSAQWSASPLFMSDDRFSQYGRLAPKSTADFAFVQHMIHHLADNGIMAVVAPHGVLFRGGAEAHIRQYLIEDRNYLDAVIGLPANIFYGTGIPTCVMVFKKCKEQPNEIVFIDASKGFEKAGNQNYLRKSHIDTIISAYRERKTIVKYSYVASLDEVKENNYNLNIPRYVDTFEQEEAVDITAVSKALKALDKDMAKTDDAIAAFCDELEIATPF